MIFPKQFSQLPECTQGRKNWDIKIDSRVWIMPWLNGRLKKGHHEGLVCDQICEQLWLKPCLFCSFDELKRLSWNVKKVKFQHSSCKHVISSNFNCAFSQKRLLPVWRPFKSTVYQIPSLQLMMSMFVYAYRDTHHTHKSAQLLPAELVHVGFLGISSPL